MINNRLERILGHITQQNPEDVFFQNVSNSQDDVVILSIARTPLGSFNGVLSSLSATQLGSAAIKGAINRAKISPEDVDAVYMGNVLQANLGQAPARQAALGAGVPVKVPCTTVNKVCASGMKAIMLAASEIKLGHAKVVIAGGMESMSNAPYYLPQVRQGLRTGDNKVIDGLMKDGLSDPYGNQAMGVIAEKTAETYQITRKEQDDYAIESYKRAAKAWSENKFADEVVPIEVTVRGQKKNHHRR
jgi:acetyl-CoA C-acetyltransferase